MGLDRVIPGSYWGYIRVILGLYWGYILELCWGYIGMREKEGKGLRGGGLESVESRG